MSKELKGEVVSDKMAKTVVVKVGQIRQHRRFLKRVKRHQRYFAHDDLGAKVGDWVMIESCRPLSKRKRWKVKEVLKKG